VIAHRGASGYLPEHTLAAKEAAHAMGADYLEQDLVLTKDNRLLVLHDLTLDRVTNVAVVYPGRARADGRHYALDFTLEEIRKLEVAVPRGGMPPLQPLPDSGVPYHLHTFEEELDRIAAWNAREGRTVGVYPEIKEPAFHLAAGRDLSRAVLEALKARGYVSREDSVYVQCFDESELRRIRRELLPGLGMDVRLVQLIGIGREHAALRRPEGVRRVAEYAQGVGPVHSLLVVAGMPGGRIRFTPLLAAARQAGLVVHPYTFRADHVPAYARDFEDWLDIFLHRGGVEGVFTDHPDRAARYVGGGE
jgi:glycerophosphoryl diester phosphodiesterase